MLVKISKMDIKNTLRLVKLPFVEKFDFDNFTDYIFEDSNNSITSFLHSKEWQEYRLLQPFWDFLLTHVGRENMGDPIFPVVVSVSFYFISMLMYMPIDLLGEKFNFLYKYKMQVDRPVPIKQMAHAASVTLWNQIMWIFPVSVAQWIFTPTLDIPDKPPPVLQLFLHVFLCFAVFDMEYFVWHSTHHKIRFLYRWIHSVHHQYYSPFAWSSQYLHPFELFCVGVYNTTVPWIFDAHPLSYWTFSLMNIAVSVEAHCGYDFPWLPHNMFIIKYWWGGAPKHDMHHYRPLSNFQPFFSWFDRIMGTECPGFKAGGAKTVELVEYEKKDKLKRTNRHWF